MSITPHLHEIDPSLHGPRQVRRRPVSRLVPGLRSLALGLLVLSCSPDLLFQPPAVASITVTGPASVLGVGEAVTLVAEARRRDGTPLEGVPVQWQSANPAVATVSAEGRVVAIGAGSTNIVARFADISGLYGITVQAPAPTCSTANPPAEDQLLCTSISYSIPATGTNITRSYRLGRSTSANFSVLLSGGTGDADLYVYTPSGALVCFLDQAGNNETCTLTGAVGTWTIGVKAFSSFSGVLLRIP